MTKPRKEQVQNLKTNYRTLLGTAAIISDTISNLARFKNDTGAGTYYYTDFLNLTYTKVPRGADKSSPAIVYADVMAPGPWTVTIGDSFTIRMTGLNSGNPMSVAIQAGDLTSIGGVNRLTTFALCDRINAVLTSFGATVPAARNERGRVIIQSVDASGYSVGSTKTIILTEVTAGLLSLLGLSLTSTITATGVNGSTRGIITESPDGLGGYVQYRDSALGTLIRPTPGASVRSLLSGTTSIQHTPERNANAPVYGRLRYVPGPLDDGRTLELGSYQQYTTVSQIILTRANISALNNTDSMTITMRDAPSFGNVVATAVIPFTNTVNPTFASIVEVINAAWASTLAGGAFTNNPRLGTVALGRGPYNFPDACGFRLSGTTINFTAGQRFTEAELATYIQAALTAASNAGSTCQVEAGIGVTIRRVSAGSDLNIQPLSNNVMKAFDVLGFTPGTYRGVNLAALYGQDAIVLTNPIPNSNIRLAAGAQTAGRLGVATTVSVSSIAGTQNPVNFPGGDFSIPEALEFWEVPDSVEADDRQFIIDAKTTTTAQAYLGNTTYAGMSSLMDASSRISTSFLPALYDILSTKRLQVFGKIAGTTNPDYVSPSFVTYTGLSDTASLNVVIEGNPDASYASGIPGLRMMFGQSKHTFTINAKQASNGVDTWTKDINGDSAFMLDFKSGILTGYTIAGATASWPTGGWSNTWSLGGAVSAANLTATGLTTGSTFNLGGDGTLFGSGSVNPRISSTRANAAGATPTANNKYTLIFESLNNGAGATVPLRIYMSHSIGAGANLQNYTSVNAFMFTTNAKWNAGGTWSRDISSERSTAWMMTSSNLYDPGDGTHHDAAFALLGQTTASWSDTGWVNLGRYNTYQNSTAAGQSSEFLMRGAGSIDLGLGSNGTSPQAIITANNIIKSWGNNIYRGTTGAPIAGANFNQASVVRATVGQYTITYTNSVGTSSNVLVQEHANASQTMKTTAANEGTNNFQIWTYTLSGGSYTLADNNSSVNISHVTMGY